MPPRSNTALDLPPSQGSSAPIRTIALMDHKPVIRILRDQASKARQAAILSQAAGFSGNAAACWEAARKFDASADVLQRCSSPGEEIEAPEGPAAGEPSALRWREDSCPGALRPKFTAIPSMNNSWIRVDTDPSWPSEIPGKQSRRIY
jgi:hypothetical protein